MVGYIGLNYVACPMDIQLTYVSCTVVYHDMVDLSCLVTLGSFPNSVSDSVSNSPIWVALFFFISLPHISFPLPLGFAPLTPVLISCKQCVPAAADPAEL